MITLSIASRSLGLVTPMWRFINLSNILLYFLRYNLLVFVGVCRGGFAFVWLASRRYPLSESYGCARNGHHQHTALAAQHLVIDVDAYDCVGSHSHCSLAHLVHSRVAGSNQLLLVCARATSYKVAYAGGKILQEIYAYDDFTKYHSSVLCDCSALNGGRGCQYHIFSDIVTFFCLLILKAAAADKLAQD